MGRPSAAQQAQVSWSWRGRAPSPPRITSKISLSHTACATQGALPQRVGSARTSCANRSHARSTDDEVIADETVRAIRESESPSVTSVNAKNKAAATEDARVAAVEQLRAIDTAATYLQTVQRTKGAKLEVSIRREEVRVQNSAATKLQAVQRSNAIKAKVATMKQDIVDGATLLAASPSPSSAVDEPARASSSTVAAPTDAVATPGSDGDAGAAALLSAACNLADNALDSAVATSAADDSHAQSWQTEEIAFAVEKMGDHAHFQVAASGVRRSSIDGATIAGQTVQETVERISESTGTVLHPIVKAKVSVAVRQVKDDVTSKVEPTPSIPVSKRPSHVPAQRRTTTAGFDFGELVNIASSVLHMMHNEESISELLGDWRQETGIAKKRTLGRFLLASAKKMDGHRDHEQIEISDPLSMLCTSLLNQFSIEIDEDGPTHVLLVDSLPRKMGRSQARAVVKGDVINVDRSHPEFVTRLGAYREFPPSGPLISYLAVAISQVFVASTNESGDISDALEQSTQLYSKMEAEMRERTKEIAPVVRAENTQGSGREQSTSVTGLTHSDFDRSTSITGLSHPDFDRSTSITGLSHPAGRSTSITGLSQPAGRSTSMTGLSQPGADRDHHDRDSAPGHDHQTAAAVAGKHEELSTEDLSRSRAKSMLFDHKVHDDHAWMGVQPDESNRTSPSVTMMQSSSPESDRRRSKLLDATSILGLEMGVHPDESNGRSSSVTKEQSSPESGGRKSPLVPPNKVHNDKSWIGQSSDETKTKGPSGTVHVALSDGSVTASVHPDFLKYVSMLINGVPLAEVNASMSADGATPDVLTLPTKASQPVKSANQAPAIPLLKEDPRWAQYFNLVNKGVSKSDVSDKMKAEGLDPSVLDMDPNKPVPSKGAGAEVNGPPPLKDDPLYAKWFKMLKMGLPRTAVEIKMKAEGLDPSVLDMDPEKPVPSKGGGEASGPPLKDDPVYAKWFKMLKMGLPRAAVEIKMKAEGLDSSVLDMDPEKPVPSKGGKVAQTKAAKASPKKPKVQQKRLHWAGHKEAVGIWKDLSERRSSGVAIDITTGFDELFVQTADQAKAVAKPAAPAKKKKEKVTLVDGKRANNGGIALARIRIPHDELRGHVIKLNDQAFAPEQLLALEDFLATEEEAGVLRKYKGDPLDLGACEKYVRFHHVFVHCL